MDNITWLRDIVLKNHTVFPEEAKTWLRLGFYVAPGKVEPEAYSPKAELFCNMVMVHIPYEMGIAIRQNVIKNCHAVYVYQPDDLDELEDRRG